MTEDIAVGDKVLYDGVNRPSLRDSVGEVKAVRRDRYQNVCAALVDFDNGTEEWVGINALYVVPQYPEIVYSIKPPSIVDSLTAILTAAKAVVDIKNSGTGDLFAAIDHLGTLI